jgi:copper oxidase (laccase) domain-containing protein
VAHGLSNGPVTLGETPVSALWTGTSDGDQRPVIEGNAAPPVGVPSDRHITGLRQVHGGGVVVVSPGSNARGPGSDSSGHDLREGDAVVASDDATCGAVLVADCVPIAIGSAEGVRAAVHAGWRGLVAGVVGNAASAVRAAGGSSLVAGVGPCIGPCCYEFSPDDLDTVESELGLSVRATTRSGAPALDLRACALGALESAGVEVCFSEPSCTSCSTGWYSARARGDVPRQALYVWRTMSGGSLTGEHAQS